MMRMTRMMTRMTRMMKRKMRIRIRIKMRTKMKMRRMTRMTRTQHLTNHRVKSETCVLNTYTHMHQSLVSMFPSFPLVWSVLMCYVAHAKDSHTFVPQLFASD